MKAEQNELITRVGPGTPCGAVLRAYWQPVALVDEFDPGLDPRMKDRPVKAVRVLGQDLVLFRDAAGRWGLLDRDCPHRNADLSFGRHEGDGLRCPFHGWKFDATGRCLETPAEPTGSKLCERVKQRSYPVVEKSGVLFAWFGDEGKAPPFPAFDCFAAPDSHTFAFKGLWQANWLQAFEVGIDPAHPSFLHRFLSDAALEAVGENAAGRQFRSASAGDFGGEKWPMTRIMREFHQPDISFATKPWGLQLTALRPMTDELTHVRITHAIFPHTFVIPLSETLTITQMHVPVDDTRTYWYSFFTSFAGPVDKDAMRSQRLQFISLPDYVPKNGRHNHWGFNPDEQRAQTYLGMGEEDINVHDQWAVESMGPIQDRTREHLGTSDKVIMANRRMLLQAIETVQAGGTAPGVADPALAAEMRGPDTVDGIAPAGAWGTWWQEKVQAKRAGAPWLRQAIAPAEAQAS
ncbi:Rieske 2Fe-2S domain-containing protein [Ramlibacter pallidus]|uniref:Rieske 2Fe-2S domain-containing protein n=1 Tax=Ramlibacter pallidus TaxID=2780087 RepID=A0ABR9S6T2_9BURK|nr:Rieske 2Fe-2S domain-containing protein [Ramlibacter pallidus]MBE7369223.1 Rieske 2Fe-2S domain-containing protein [Ramlibacter pallidus]